MKKEIPLERIAFEARPGRIYMTYRVPQEEGGGVIRVRLNASAEDRQGKGHRRDSFNRGEYVRAVPTYDPAWGAVYPRRNDAESGHRLIDDSMPRERSHSVGLARQWFDMHTWQLFENSRALELHRRRYGGCPPVEQLAA